MRRISLWLLGTVAALVLLFSYRTSTGGPAPGVAAPGIVSGDAPAGDPADPSAGTGGGVTPPSGSGSGTVVNGTVARTRWGPVQVQVQLSGRRIVDVRVLQQPNGNRTDREINAYALPQLREQVLQAQSANVDGVSGATVTSDGYRESLQSALAAAHLTS
jgi:uncharacterized protein with FMN-binding domain